ncbi:hypothetical protein BC829DRAFT_429816 [Chytridium lagenaria]|nr:hypothetical protein BC829DRAFT_429816 [Chytridium lagenaria]
MDPAVVSLLESINLSKYIDALTNAGFDSVDALKEATFEDLTKAGVITGHARLLLRRLETKSGSSSNNDVHHGAAITSSPNFPIAPPRRIVSMGGALMGIPGVPGVPGPAPPKRVTSFQVTTPEVPTRSPAQPTHAEKAKAEKQVENQVIELQKDWRCKEGKEVHDFFISYRVEAEKTSAQFIKLLIAATSSHHAYLDKDCLVPGSHWDIGFLNGLMRSHLIILLCSEDALVNVRLAHHKPDNMLLEWEIALDRMELRNSYILPLFMAKFGNEVTRKFNAFDISTFPDEKHCHHWSPKRRTIRETIKAIFKLQAIKVNDDDMKIYIPSIIGVYNQFKENLATTPIEKKTELPSTSTSEAFDDGVRLTAEEDEKLLKWLSPVTEDMDLEMKMLKSRHAEGTRSWLLEDVVRWATDLDSSRVMWLRGDAGVGKSIMAAVVATDLLSKARLGTAFFCRYNNHLRNSPRSLILTFAYGLTQWDASVGEDILQISQEKPDLLSEPNSVIFRELILEPLLRFEKRLRADTRNYPTKIFVTGRPEPDIVAAFEKTRIPTQLLGASADNNLIDARIYVSGRLKKEAKLQNPQELDEISNIIVQRSEGIFLRLVLASDRLIFESKTNPIHLDFAREISFNEADTYRGVFERLDQLVGPAGRSITYALTCGQEPLSPNGLARLLNLDDKTVEIAITCLNMVVNRSTNAHGISQVAFRHKTVADCLLDENNTHFRVDPEAANAELAAACARQLSASLKVNLCGLEMPCVPHSHIKGFEDLVQESVTETLRYSAKHFISHAAQSGAVDASADELLNLISSISETKLLQWLEVLSLTGGLRGAIEWLTPFRKWLESALPLQNPASKRQIYLWKDLHRLLQANYSAIEDNALQAYQIALALCPTETTFYMTYYEPTNAIIPVPKVVGGPKHWDACLAILKGHRTIVTSVAVSPDGAFIASGSYDETVRMWEANTGSCRRTFTASGSEDQTVRIWDVGSGMCEFTFTAHQDDVMSVAFSPDGRKLASASEDKTVRIWNLSTGGHTRVCFYCVAFSNDGNYIVSGSGDKTIRMWNLSTGSAVELRGHLSSVNTIAFSRDGTRVVSGSIDKTICIWSVPSGARGRSHDGADLTVKGHTGTVKSVAFSPDGRKVASTSFDMTIRLWDAATGTCERVLEGHSGPVSSIVFSPDGSRVISGSDDRSVRMWDLKSDHLSQRQKFHPEMLSAAAVWADGAKEAWACKNDTEIFDASTGVWIPTVDKDDETWVEAMSFSPDGMSLATGGSNDCTIRIWDTSSGKCQQRLVGHSYWVHSLAFSRDGSKLLSASKDKSIRIWDLSKNAFEQTFWHTDPVTAVAFSPDGSRVASVSSRMLRVWVIATRNVR